MLSDQSRGVPLLMWLTVELCQVVCWGCMTCSSSVGKAWDQGNWTEISVYLMKREIRSVQVKRLNNVGAKKLF